MYLLILIFSCLLLGSVAIDSPLAIFKEWTPPELASLIFVFLFLFFLAVISKKIKSTYRFPAAVLLLIILIQFNIAAVSSVALIALVAAVIGTWIAGTCVSIDNSQNLSSDMAMRLGIGYALLIGIFQISVHFSINTYQIYILFFFSVLVVLHRETKYVINDITQYSLQKFDLPSYKFFVPVGVALSILVYVAFPETHSDALMVNLHIANQIDNNSNWSFNTLTEVWALWPKGAAWMYAAHYILAGEMAARLFNWFAIAVTALIIGGEAIRLGYGKNIWLLLSLYLSTPITFWCGFVLFDDAVFCLLVTATIVYTISASKLLTPRKLFVVSLFSSAAIATKISGLFLIPIVLFIFSYRFLVSKDAGKLQLNFINILKYSCSILLFLVVGLTSYIFSFVKTGNPIFPLYNDFFKSDGFPFIRFEDARWYANFGLTGIYKMTANTSLYNEGRNWTLGIHYGLFFIPVLVELFLQRKNADLFLYGLSALIFSILVFNQIHYVRYLYPIFPVYCLLVISSMSRFNTNKHQFFIALLALFCIFINLLNVKSLNMYYHFDFISFSKGENRQFVNYSEKQLNDYINNDYGPSSVVLYVHRPYSANLNGNAFKYHWTSPVIKASVDEIKNQNDLRDFILKYHITHVVWDRELFPSVPLALYDLLPDFATLQKNISTVELWKVNMLPVVSGAILNIKKPDALENLNLGWMPSESWGTWSKGNASTLIFRILPNNVKDYLHITFKVMPYAPPNRIDELVVNIFSNGEFIKSVSLKPIQQFTSIDADVPKAMLSSVMTIEFKFSKPFDESTLQLGFSEASFVYE